MCGICGVAGSGLGKAGRERLPAMSALLMHRGPDNEGTYFDEDAALGHRRLSIIDLSRGRQPISNEDGSVWIVYNGEVYNFPELRSELLSKGHVFSTGTDTEVIVHLYEEYGTDAFWRLNGMFAFALWDKRQKTLLLARDRAGVKPLYYGLSGGRLFFSSEISSLAAGLDARPMVDPESVYLYLLLQYVPGPRTIFKDIYKLPPGHFLAFRDGEAMISGYWTPPARGRDAGDGERLLALLDHAVESQLVSDVPLGAFLSGGLDSAGVTALARRHKGEIKTFSIGFEGPKAFDESALARGSAAYIGTEHHETLFGPADFIELFPRAVSFMDEPIADPAALPTLKLAGFAREHVKVVLTGEGSDELFGGYLRYSLESLAGGMHALWGAAGRAAAGLVRDRRKAKAIAALSARNWAEAHLCWSSVFTKDELRSLCGAGCSGAWDAAVSAVSARGGPGGARVERMLEADLRSWLPDNLLTKVDRMTMAASLEARVPYLDNGVVDYALSLPAGAKLRGLKTKRVLKNALGRILPREVVDRRKRGFDLPLACWFRGPLREFVEGSLEGPALAFIDRGFLRRIREEHMGGEKDWSLPLFGIMVINEWHRKAGR